MFGRSEEVQRWEKLETNNIIKKSRAPKLLYCNKCKNICSTLTISLCASEFHYVITMMVRHDYYLFANGSYNKLLNIRCETSDEHGQTSLRVFETLELFSGHLALNSGIFGFPLDFLDLLLAFLNLLKASWIFSLASCLLDCCGKSGKGYNVLFGCLLRSVLLAFEQKWTCSPKKLLREMKR